MNKNEVKSVDSPLKRGAKPPVFQCADFTGFVLKKAINLDTIHSIHSNKEKREHGL